MESRFLAGGLLSRRSRALPFAMRSTARLMARYWLRHKCMSAKRKTVDERFLADQVERMRHLVDQLTLAQESVWDDSEALLTSGEIGPLESVRDYRTYQPSADEHVAARPRGGPLAHSVRHDSPIRKRKR